VALLGKGWMGRWENVGIVSWYFDDGTALYVLPKEYKADATLTFKDSKGSKMWWHVK
jgi:hypothetical protein